MKVYVVTHFDGSYYDEKREYQRDTVLAEPGIYSTYDIAAEIVRDEIKTLMPVNVAWEAVRRGTRWDFIYRDICYRISEVEVDT